MKPVLTAFALVAVVEAMLVSAPARAADVAAPATSPTWTFPHDVNDVALPAQFVNGVIVIRMTVGAQSRGIDMSLDTGAGFNILDTAVMASIENATVAESPLTITDVQFGTATLHNVQFASRSFARRYGTDTRIVGVLGFGFLESAVVKIDYEHETVHLINPDGFTVPKTAAVLELDPTSKVPIVSATIGKASGRSFIIDTGASTVVAFPRLAKANPEEFTAQQELRDDAQSTYYRSFWPLCGEIRQNPYAVSHVTLGTVGIREWTVWKPDDKSCFAPAGIDGLIGYDFLRLFNVYIDYPNNRVILEPNTLYEAATNTIKW
jgi:hypothetical protein